jgi:hypothetical protein
LVKDWITCVFKGLLPYVDKGGKAYPLAAVPGVLSLTF